MKNDEVKLIERVVALATKLPKPILDQFCCGLDELPSGCGVEEAVRSLNSVAQPDVRDALHDLIGTLAGSSAGISPRELAWALRGAGAVDDFHRSLQSLELVWTGPVPEGMVFRRTDQALLEIIRSAQSSLIIVTFVAYKIRQIAAALEEAAARGVRILFVLETPESSDGKVEFSAIRAIGESLKKQATVCVWPREKRETDEQGRYGSLHAKAAIADDKFLLLSSANLTHFALSLNIEMGLLVKGGDLPMLAAQHFRALIDKKVLVRIS